MKKHTRIFIGVVALSVILIASPIGKAQTIIDTAAAVSIGQTLDSATVPSHSLQNNVREKIRSTVPNYDEKIQNVKNNQDYRNNLLEARKNVASTTNAEVRDTRVNAKKDMKTASTTIQKYEIRAELRKDVFKIELTKIVSQLNLSLNNLKQIRIRIESRIEKVTQTGRDMSKAKNLLVIANNKIALAEQAIISLKSLETSTLTAIKLEKPRQIGAVAIKAVNDARKALNDVVVAIAHSMGLKLGTATTTNTVAFPTNSATPVVSTSTNVTE